MSFFYRSITGMRTTYRQTLSCCSSSVAYSLEEELPHYIKGSYWKAVRKGGTHGCWVILAGQGNGFTGEARIVVRFSSLPVYICLFVSLGMALHFLISECTSLLTPHQTTAHQIPGSPFTHDQIVFLCGTSVQQYSCVVLCFCFLMFVPSVILFLLCPRFTSHPACLPTLSLCWPGFESWPCQTLLDPILPDTSLHSFTLQINLLYLQFPRFFGSKAYNSYMWTILIN